MSTLPPNLIRPSSEPSPLFNQVREFALEAPPLSEPDSPQANQIRAFRSRTTRSLAPNLIRRRPRTGSPLAHRPNQVREFPTGGTHER